MALCFGGTIRSSPNLRVRWEWGAGIGTEGPGGILGNLWAKEERMNDFSLVEGGASYVGGILLDPPD